MKNQKLNLTFILSFLTLVSYSYSSAREVSGFEIYRSGGVGYVDCSFGNKILTEGCLFDTGAGGSKLPEELFGWSSPLKILDSHKSEGVGCSSSCEQIQVSPIRIGNFESDLTKIDRCTPSFGKGLMGIDSIDHRAWRFDLAQGVVELEAKIPPNLNTQKLRRDSFRRIYVPVKLGGIETLAVLDTGASHSVVDSSFVEKHKQLFEFVSESLVKTSCAKIEVINYILNNISVGKRTGSRLRIASYDFSGPLNDAKARGAAVVLGFDVISGLKWHFDLNKDLWTIED